MWVMIRLSAFRAPLFHPMKTDRKSVASRGDLEPAHGWVVNGAHQKLSQITVFFGDIRPNSGSTARVETL
jgi:hypothetical protein